MLIVSDYIHTHLNEDLSLEQLANVGCLSKFHFLRLFKIAFNKTPYQFINEERVRMGRQMIERTRISINEIAYSLGFMNPSSFSQNVFQSHRIVPYSASAGLSLTCLRVPEYNSYSNNRQSSFAL